MRTFAEFLRDVVARSADALCVLEVDERPVAAFLVRRRDAEPRLVTALHTVAEADALTLRLADGRNVAIDALAAVDTARDLALFRLPESVAGAFAVTLDGPVPEVDEGQTVVAQGQPGDASALCAFLTGSREEVSEDLSLVLLPALAPSGASGSAVFDEHGALVGVATRVLSNVGPLAVMVPAIHLLPLLDIDERRPLSDLAELPVRRRIERRVPHHALSLLDGCSRSTLEDIGSSIVAAIQIGAPAYNDGEIARCYQVYEECARKLVERAGEAPGPRTALLEGLARAAALNDPDAQAWAMRDTFDGLLGVLERWMEHRDSPSVTTPKRKPILN
jgi:serine protease Do